MIMLRVTLWHEPEYFGFYIKDPGAEISMGPSEATEVEQHRFAARQGIVTVGVKSEYTTIPITVEFDQLGAEPPERTDWDRIVECSLAIHERAIVFEGSTGTEFGRLEVPPGNYRTRIHYGGQNIIQGDGETGDFYLIQIWPSSDVSSIVIKSE
jgi:hypothetical protein